MIKPTAEQRAEAEKQARIHGLPRDGADTLWAAGYAQGHADGMRVVPRPAPDKSWAETVDIRDARMSMSIPLSYDPPRMIDSDTTKLGIWVMLAVFLAMTAFLTFAVWAVTL